MEKRKAIELLKSLKGKEFQILAKEYNVSIITQNGKINKGWAGHTIEKFLGLSPNIKQSPDFNSWELKVIPMRFLKNGKLTFKETMAITMINPYDVVQKSFEESHLYLKLKEMVVVVRIVGRNVFEKSYLYDVFEINLNNKEIFNQVKQDYEFIRNILKRYKNPYEGLNYISGRMGIYIQPRTKGVKRGSKTRAFYARKNFLRLFVNW